MNLYIGNKKPASIYFGNNAVAAIYSGNALIWQKGPRFVKYHLDFRWWSSGNANLFLAETYINGTTAGNRLLDGGRYESGGGAYNIDSTTINKLRNAESVSIYGDEVELNYSATDISSIGFRTDPNDIDITTFTVYIIGDDINNNHIVLLSDTVTISKGQTYTFNL